jgi:hypothetical protein
MAWRTYKLLLLDFGLESSLAPPPFTEVHVPSHESEQSCMCVLGVLILHISTILRVGIMVANAILKAT